MPFLGESIALITVLCWTISIQFFTSASREAGATAVNLLKIAFALVLFSLYLLYTNGFPLPLDFPLRAWWYLGLSGVIGFFIGDIFLFKALVELGPRVATLMHSLAAPTSAIIGWLFLNESYELYQWTGILVTFAGVSLVISEKKNSHTRAASLGQNRISFRGIGLGLGAMLGQAGGYVLSKAGMQTETGYLDAFASTQIRALAAFICFILFFTFTGNWAHIVKAIHNRKVLKHTLYGSILGPFIGVSLSLLALHYLPTGIAATFLSLVPICIIPFSIFLHKEQVSFRAIAGAVIAVFGIHLLMT